MSRNDPENVARRLIQQAAAKGYSDTLIMLVEMYFYMLTGNPAPGLPDNLPTMLEVVLRLEPRRCETSLRHYLDVYDPPADPEPQPEPAVNWRSDGF